MCLINRAVDMDNTFYKQYKIFVSSPGDVKTEREIVDGEAYNLTIKI